LSRFPAIDRLKKAGAFCANNGPARRKWENAMTQDPLPPLARRTVLKGAGLGVGAGLV